MGVTTNDTRDCSKFSSVVSTGEEASALCKSASSRLFYSCLNDHWKSGRIASTQTRFNLFVGETKERRSNRVYEPDLC